MPPYIHLRRSSSSLDLFDYASKNLTSVSLTGLSDGNVDATLRTTGVGVMTSLPEGMPLLYRPGWRNEVRWPLKVKFRLAPGAFPEAVQAFERVHHFYEKLAISDFTAAEDYISWWHVPEGLLAIAIDRSAVPLLDFWASDVRPGIEESERVLEAQPGTSRRLRVVTRDTAAAGGETREVSPGFDNRRKGEREERAEVADCGREEVGRGYVRGLEVLINVAEIILQLHERRIATVVVRPDWFQVIRPPHTSSPTGFWVELTRLTMATTLTGYDDAKVVSGLPGQTTTTLAAPFDSPSLEEGGRASPKHEGVSGALAGIHSESIIRAHQAYLAPDVLASEKASGVSVDVFSFGVMAYQLLSGELPYGRKVEGNGESPEKLLDILSNFSAKSLVPLPKLLPSIPNALWQVIQKCLNINPSKRYVTCQALMYDLRRIRDICAGDLSGKDHFIVGDIDYRSRFRFPKVPRAEELQQMDGAYAEIRRSKRARSVCVWGTSGSGKSTFFETWLESMEAKKEVYLVGRARFHQHPMRPMSVTLQLLEDILTALWSDPLEDHAAWRHKILAVLGDQTTVVLDAMPAWKDVLLNRTPEKWNGKTTTNRNTPTGDHDWAHLVSTIKSTMCNLFRIFGTAKRPLILVAEDIHWADSLERELLRDLVEHPERRLYHALVCKSIWTETDDDKPALLDKQMDRMTLVHLRAISCADVRDILKRSLHIDGELDESITFLHKYLHTITKGNLFYLKSLCYELWRTGVLYFNFGTQLWTVRMNALSLYRTSDIGDFAQMVVSELPTDIKRLLRILAFLPPTGAPLSLLVQLSSLTEKDASVMLRKAANLGLVSMAESGVQFQYDTVRVAVLSLSSDRELAGEKLQVARTLKSIPGDTYVFPVSDLLVSVHNVLGDTKVDPLELRELILDAADRANRAAAFELSASYLEKVGRLLGSNPWIEARSSAFRRVKLLTAAAGALGEIEGVMPLINDALAISQTVDERLMMLLLRVKAVSLNHDSAAVRENIKAAFELFGENEMPRASPESVEVLMALLAAPSDPSSELQVERAGIILEILAFAGPTLFSTCSDGGLPYFDAGLAIVIRYRAALNPAGAYVLLMRGLLFVRDLHIRRARVCLNLAKSVNTRGSYWAPYTNIITFGYLAYISTSSAKLVNYDKALLKLRELEDHETASRVTGIRAFDRFFSSQISLKSVQEGGRDLANMEGQTSKSGKILLAAMTQLTENVFNPVSDVTELQDLAGSYIPQGEVMTQDLAPLSAFSYSLARLWTATLFQADPSRLRRLAHDLALYDTAGGGLLLSVDAVFLRAVVAYTSDGPLSKDDFDVIHKCRATFAALGNMAEVELRSKALKAFEQRWQARTGQAHWLDALEGLDVAIDFAQKIQHHLIAGWLALGAANLVEMHAPKRHRLSSGYVISSHESWSTLRASGLMRLVSHRFPDVVPGKNTQALVQVDKQVSTTIASSSRVSALVAASTTSSSERNGTGEADTSMDSNKLDTKLAMESILSAFLVLASERDSQVIRKSLLATAIRLQRGDWAALSIVDATTNEMKLVAAGFVDDLQTWDDLKIADATHLCPMSIISLVATTKRPVRYGEPRTRHIFRKDPFFLYPPKSAICHPLSVQGRFAGCLVVASSQRPFNEKSDTPVDLLATFALIALEANKTKENMEAMIARALQTQASFTTSLTHETRTPLFTILGLIEVVESTPGMSASQKENLAMIRTSSETLHKLIGDILDLSKLEAGGITSTDAPFDLHEVVEEAIYSLGHLSQAKDLELVLMTPLRDSPPTEMVGDAFRVRQCLINLVGNAVKFTPSGGRVSVQYSITWEGSQCDVEIRVTDTGIGIQVEQQKKLFKAFSQLDPSRPGSGLGLSITRNLSRVLGGDTWMESEFGHGSTFFFSMVCKATERKEIAQMTKPGLGKTALIVGPDIWTITMLKENLTYLGIRCVDHKDPDVKSTSFDIIFQCMAFSEAHTEKSISSYPNTPTHYLMSISDETKYADLIPRNSMVHLPVKASKLIAIVEGLFSTSTPVAKVTAGTRAKIPAGFAETHPLKMAFIDDNYINTQVGLKLLAKYGYKKGVDVGHDGAEAVAMAKKVKYDLIFLDLQMPIMDGHQAMLLLKTMQIAGSPAVVALTANCDQATRDLCVAEGFTSFLEKPVNIAALTRILEEVYEAKMRDGKMGNGGGEGEGVTVS